MRWLLLLSLACAACSDGAAANDDGAVDGAAIDAATFDAPTSGADLTVVNPGVPFVYVGGYAGVITRYRLNPQSGQLGPAATTAFTGSPSFLAVDDAHTHLYAVNEQTAGQVASFAIDQASGALTHLNDVSSGGNGPAHVSVDHSGKWVMAANYGDGTIGVWPVQPDGSLGAPSDTRAAGANAHQIVASLSNLVVFVPCLGAGYVAQFTFDASSGKLTPNPVPHVTTPAGAGPRHLAFHPNGTIAYLIAETNSTISAYHLDGAGQLTSMQTVSTLPPVFTGTNTAAEIWVHPSGKFLYGSNRGDDSIAIFTLDAAGMMTAKAFPKSGGQNPRDFTLDPTGQWLLVANQGSGSLDVFRIDATTGLLTPSGSVTVSMPSFVGVVTLPGS